MKKYLVILNIRKFTAEIDNVAVIFAESEEEARRKYIENQTLHIEKNELQIYPLDEITTDWYYW